MFSVWSVWSVVFVGTTEYTEYTEREKRGGGSFLCGLCVLWSCLEPRNTRNTRKGECRSLRGVPFGSVKAGHHKSLTDIQLPVEAIFLNPFKIRCTHSSTKGDSINR